MTNEEYVMRVLRSTSLNTYDACHDVFWRSDGPTEHPIQFWVLCNDVFYWGCADAEDITPENVHLLEQAMADAGDSDGLTLFCCRVRGMRPQKPALEWFNDRPKMKALIEACGPERNE